MNYYVEQNAQIVLFDTDKQKIEQTIEFMPQYKGLDIKETDRPIVNFEFADTPDYIAKQLLETKATAQTNHTANHLAYQTKTFAITIKRDNSTKPNLVLYFDCTDNTRQNIQSAQTKVDAFDSVYFYDGLGVGDYLSKTEMAQVSTQFTNRLDPSFIIKGKGKYAINQTTDAANLATLPDKYNNYFNQLYDLLNAGKTPEEITTFISNLEF